MKKPHILVFLLALLITKLPVYSKTDTTTYYLTIEQGKVNKTGKEVMGMTTNGSIPGPTLQINEGGYAVIYVKNEMNEETSIHWHGLLLPNFYFRGPYLTTPPIEPGETQEYAKCVNDVIYFKSYVRENETIRHSFLWCNNLL